MMTGHDFDRQCMVMTLFGLMLSSVIPNDGPAVLAVV
jgi:hypothetical protein